MDIIRAKELLAALADGVNPITGEVLSERDSCNQVEIVRALHTVLKKLDSVLEGPKQLRLENAGKPWTKGDEEILCRMFDTGCTPKEISNQLGRTNGAIAAKLVRLQKIKERSEWK